MDNQRLCGPVYNEVLYMSLSLHGESTLPAACNLIPREAVTFLFSWLHHGTGSIMDCPLPQSNSLGQFPCSS